MRGNLARQLVVGKIQHQQIISVLRAGPSQVAQLSWDGPRQTVVVEVQLPQRGEGTQLRGDGARQLVVVEVQVP